MNPIRTCNGCNRPIGGVVDESPVDEGFCTFCGRSDPDELEELEDLLVDEEEVEKTTEEVDLHQVVTDRENDRIIFGDFAMQLQDGSGEIMTLDHVSQLDGYVAFESSLIQEYGGVTVTFREGGDWREEEIERDIRHFKRVKDRLERDFNDATASEAGYLGDACKSVHDAIEMLEFLVDNDIYE